MKESAATIQAYLTQDLKLINSDKVLQWRKDERKTVQKALKSYDIRCAKAQEETHHLLSLRKLESQLHQEGYRYIAGVDEVGRGPLAGPVVTAAVILPEDMPLVAFDDSKRLSHAKRQELVQAIKTYAIAYAIDVQGPEVIDAINILEATKKSMKASLQALQPACDYAVIDAVGLEGLSVPSQHPIKGDATVYCIAAASILAKEYRDDLMRAYAKQYPQYGFDHHFGYGTKEHLEALAAYGPCPIHRKTFAPVKAYL